MQDIVHRPPPAERLVGNPTFPAFHLPTRYFDIESTDSRKRLKAYAIDGMEVQTGADWHNDVWSAGVGIPL